MSIICLWYYGIMLVSIMAVKKHMSCWKQQGDKLGMIWWVELICVELNPGLYPQARRMVHTVCKDQKYLIVIHRQITLHSRMVCFQLKARWKPSNCWWTIYEFALVQHCIQLVAMTYFHPCPLLMIIIKGAICKMIP